MDQVVHKVVRFNRFELDLTRGCLRTGKQEIELRPKAFQLLAYLAANAGRLVPKQELLDAIWPNVVVSDESLVQSIRQLRRSLGDDNHRLIKTVSRRGYLFDVATSASEVASTGRAVETSRPAEAPLSALPLPDRPSIAVLPFTNMSGDPEQSYFSDGITEDIITELSRFSELFVIASNSSFQYRGKPRDLREIGHALGVRYLLEGSIRRAGERVRITVQLIDAANGGHRWAERYDRDLKDVFEVQDDVARTIASILVAHVNKAEVERTLNKPAATWQAYDYYMRAADILISYHSSFNLEDLYEARRLLQHAITIDPNYARSLAALAMSHVSSWVHPFDKDFQDRAALDRAYQAARKATQLNPSLPQAHVALGWALIWMRDHDAAIAEFERATVLNPNFTNWRFAFSLVFAGASARAVQVLEAHMRLDPFYEPYAPGTLGFAYYMQGRYAEALPRLRECVSRAPNMRPGHLWLAATYAQLGQFDHARAEAAEILRLVPSYTNGAPLSTTFKLREDAEHLVDGLRKAGLPDT